jgi:predicted metal-dependent peptidase
MFALRQQLTAEQRIAKAYVDITSHERYTALSGVLSIGTKTVSDTVPTACTNGRDELYGRAFVDSLTDAELRFLMLHECYHKMYRHLITWKHLNEKNPTLANASCDYNINGKLVDENKDDGFAQMPRDEDGEIMGLFDEQYRNADGSWMDTAAIFSALDNGDVADQPQGGDGTPQGFDEHDWEGANELSADEIKQLEREVDEAIRQGSTIAGKLGNNGNRNLAELMQPQVDWREVLREFIQTTCTGNDYSTWKRPNRRYIGADVYLPSGISEKIDELVIAVDTSGSISDHAVALFLSEVQSICTTVKPDKVRLLYWGHRVVGDESYDTHELGMLTQSTKVKGGGGTDVNCVTDYMQAHNIKPQATVVLTDGYLFGDWGTWDCPVLWCVLDNKSATPDNGKVAHIQTSSM